MFHQLEQHADRLHRVQGTNLQECSSIPFKIQRHQTFKLRETNPGEMMSNRGRKQHYRAGITIGSGLRRGCEGLKEGDG